MEIGIIRKQSFLILGSKMITKLKLYGECWEIKYIKNKNSIIVRSNGSIEYRKHGKLHRVDGPALIERNGYGWFYTHGNIQHRKHWLNGAYRPIK